MLKTIICCVSVFLVILLIGWILGLIMIHLFEKKIKQQKPSSVVVHINDDTKKANTYSIQKIKRELRPKPKRVEGFQSGCCAHHSRKAKRLKQRVKAPKRQSTPSTSTSTTTSPDKPVIETFDPFIGRYQRQSAKAERRFTKQQRKPPLSGFNINEYTSSGATLS